jgi:hypothetical protein
LYEGVQLRSERVAGRSGDQEQINTRRDQNRLSWRTPSPKQRGQQRWKPGLASPKSRRDCS